MKLSKWSRWAEKSVERRQILKFKWNIQQDNPVRLFWGHKPTEGQYVQSGQTCLTSGWYWAGLRAVPRWNTSLLTKTKTTGEFSVELYSKQYCCNTQTTFHNVGKVLWQQHSPKSVETNLLKMLPVSKTLFQYCHIHCCNKVKMLLQTLLLYQTDCTWTFGAPPSRSSRHVFSRTHRKSYFSQSSQKSQTL